MYIYLYIIQSNVCSLCKLKVLKIYSLQKRYQYNQNKESLCSNSESQTKTHRNCFKKLLKHIHVLKLVYYFYTVFRSISYVNRF